MLFDLHQPGRKRAVKIIYGTLAVLMAAGLVGFGIGSDINGGIASIFEDGSNVASTDTALDKEVEAALKRTQASPNDASAWVALAIARFKRAGVDGIDSSGNYTEDGKKRLKEAAVAYERHLALKPKQPNVRAAKLMVNAYGTSGLNELKKAVSAKQIVTAAEDPPTSNSFQQLALLAYQAGEVRVGDLAAARAIDLADPDERKELRQQLELLKSTGTQGVPSATGATTG